MGFSSIECRTGKISAKDVGTRCTTLRSAKRFPALMLHRLHRATGGDRSLLVRPARLWLGELSRSAKSQPASRAGSAFRSTADWILVGSRRCD
jgi:hypothetical protein